MAVGTVYPRHLKKCQRNKGKSARQYKRCKCPLWLEGNNFLLVVVSVRHGSFPPISMLQDVLREHIAPWDERNKNNSHQDGFDILCRRRIDLVGGP